MNVLGNVASGIAIALLVAAPARAVDVEATVAALEALRTRYAADPSALPMGFETRQTAWQTASRHLVLAGGRTPDEEDPYVMTHPLFLFRWADGSLLIADAGLAPDGARSFGRPLEFLGADAMVCGGGAFEGIDPSAVRAAVFSHLHVDHIQGLGVLCADGDPIPIRLSPEQDASDERFEAAGREELAAMAEAGCVRSEAFGLRDAATPAPALSGFPGIHRIAVPGHTPGSQLIVGFVRVDGAAPRAIVIAGDVVNHRAGIRHDRPKPWLYRRLVVPEDDALQAQNRALLARLEAAGFEVQADHHVPIPEGTESIPCP